MKTKTIKKCFLTTFVLTLLVALAILPTAGRVRAATFAAEYFTYANASATEAVTGQGGRKGMRINGYGVGASATTRHTLSGKLELDLSVETAGLKRFCVRVADVENPNNGFDVLVEVDGAEWNVGVEAFGNRAGIYYAFGKTAFKTADNSKSGTYTRVAASSVGNRLTFDPTEMTVTVSDGDEERLVWNFSYRDNDGYTLGGTLDAIARYKTAILFDRTDASGAIMLYAVNGQRFDTPYLYGGGADSAAPEIFADVAVRAVKNSPYAIPQPITYDVIDGNIEDVSVEVLDGYTVVLPKTSATGATFTPTKTGTYTLRYTARDESGKTAMYTRPLKVDETAAMATTTLSQATFPETLGKGSTVVLPTASVTTAQANRGERAFATKLTIMKNGAPITKYDDVYVKEDETFTFETVGVYTLTYTAVHAQIAATETVAVTVRDDLPAVTAIDVKARYAVGETVSFAVPTFTLADATAKGIGQLQYPSGALYNGVRHILTEAGRYTMTFTATVGGKAYSYTRAFFATDGICSVTGESNAAVGATDYLAGREGIAVSLDRNGTFTYNKVVDVSSLDKNKRLLQLYVTPQTAGVKEAEGVEVRLTDAHDPENYITVQSIWEPGDRIHGNNMSYIRAGAAGQLLVGHFGSTPDDYDYNIAKGDQAGRVVHLSMRGLVVAPRTEIAPFEIYYDHALKQILVGETSHAGWQNRMVCDLDDPLDFPTPWAGFTTGEVVISIRPFTPTKDKFNFFLTEIYGENLLDSQGVDAPPTIEVDTYPYDAALPNAIVGKPYPVFTATATAPRVGNVPVHVCAVLNYGQESAAYFDVSDGKFVPPLKGEYTLVYTAKNIFGLTTVKTLQVTAGNAATVGDMTVTVGNASTVAGQPYTVPTPTVANGFGQSKITVKYTAPDSTQGTVENGAFTPTQVGDYTLLFTAVDYLGRKAEANATLTVATIATPVFETAKMTTAFIGGVPTALPEVYAAVVEENKVVRKKADVSVKYGQTTLAVVEGMFTPKVDTSGETVTVTYTVNGATQSYDVPVKNVMTENEVHTEEYFYCKDMTVAANAESVTLTASENNATAEYLLPLVAGTFSLGFRVTPASFKENDSVRIMLADAENPAICVAFSIAKAKNAYDRTVFTAYRDTITDRLYTQGSLHSGTFDFMFRFDANFNRITDGGSLRYTVFTDAAGNRFDGFPSSKLRLTIGLQSKNNSIAVRTISEQPMSNSPEDGVGPNVYMPMLEAQTYAVGSQFTLPRAAVGDVLDPSIESFTVTVRGEGSRVVSDVNGKKLQNVSAYENYTFTLDSVGRYYITYAASDGTGNIGPARYTIRVSDTAAPEITLSSDDLGTVGRGSTVTLPTATVTGAKGDKVSVYVMRPDGKNIAVSGSTFSDTSLAGKYTVRYIAFDDYGNMAVKTATFTV